MTKCQHKQVEDCGRWSFSFGNEHIFKCSDCGRIGYGLDSKSIKWTSGEVINK